MKHLTLALVLGTILTAFPALADDTPVTLERWEGSGFTDLSLLQAIRRFVGLRAPSTVSGLDRFDTGRGLGDHYIGRVTAWLIPPATGTYTFWVASDNAARVWLTPEGGDEQLLCGNDGPTGYRQWDQVPDQQSAPISLEAGEPYWIEALLQENSGDDHLALAWSGPGFDRRVIEGAFLAATPPVTWGARDPAPGSGAEQIDPNTVVLTWEPGLDPPAPIQRYEVYLSSDPAALGRPETHQCTVTAGQPLRCDVGPLAGGIRYAWRVDTIIDTVTQAPGAIWTFTTTWTPPAVCPPGDDTCAQGPIVINEIHTDPAVKTERTEFIELCNITDQPIDLGGWAFTRGVTCSFPPGSVVGPRGYAVVAQDARAYEAKFRVQALATFTGKLSNVGETLRLAMPDGRTADEVTYGLGFPWPIVGEASGPSLQLLDTALDNDLGGAWRSAAPTPGAANRVVTGNAPPLLRQRKHRPQSPRTGDPVRITMKVTDSDGVQAVTCRYQVVVPGDYIRLEDSRYDTEWVALPMVDDGTAGDETAGDDIYTALIPADVQVHRRLVRYRVTAVDGAGLSVDAPYPDDPQPNFAYFVYDGVPAWTGSIRPGVAPEVTYGPEVMQSLPVYHLLSRKADVEEASWLRRDSSSVYRWRGTLVYDGEVYDHVRYRMRGGVWRYAMGKNMWKFDFLRGHRFQARDDYGRPYRETWDKLNFSACIQQGSFGQRGEQGMFEALTFKMFNLCGVPAPLTHWLQFRVIDELFEDGRLNAAHPGVTTGGTQYDGDLWGLYMAIEQMDGRFLDEHELPDGNLYKMEARYGEKNNQGATAVPDDSDIRAFKNTYETNPPTDWWGTNVRLDRYYSHVAVQHACHHGDVTSKNHFFYLNPEPFTDSWGTSSRWSLLPWDTDLTWTTYYGSMSDPFTRVGIFGRPELDLQMKNRVREICDLLFNEDQTGQLIDDLAALINDPNGGLSMVDVDRAMWDYHWVMNAAAYLSRDPSFKAGQGRFYQAAAQAGFGLSFEGMLDLMKSYVRDRQGHMESLYRDNAIPETPAITYAGSSDYAANNLLFATSPFADPQGSGTFAALRWRLAEVDPGSRYAPAPGSTPGGTPSGTVLLPAGATWRYAKGTAEPSAPGVWRRSDFDDHAWLEGTTAIGYGENFIVTPLDDMRSHYSTVYFRRHFTVDDTADLGALTLRIKYDDGYNAWINGTRVAWANVNNENEPFDAFSATTSAENHNFVEVPLTDLGMLHDGDNVLAVHVLNQSLGNSSDCFFDAELIGVPAQPQEPPDTPAGPPPVRPTEPAHYEIETLWDSGEIAPFQASIKIPASAVEPGHTYRARCRMMDRDGRWSHWSAPEQFTATAPLAEGVVRDLRVTELMYHPAPPAAGSPYGDEDFEFVELRNIGDETLSDLSSVSFTRGIHFDFAGSTITRLEPGAFLLLVSNRPAFLERYGEALDARIAGQYEGHLANSGERVVLEDFWNGTIADFTYGDGRDWPQSPDGDGYALVPRPEALVSTDPTALDHAESWRAGTRIHGTPGAEEPVAP